MGSYPTRFLPFCIVYFIFFDVWQPPFRRQAGGILPAPDVKSAGVARPKSRAGHARHSEISVEFFSIESRQNKMNISPYFSFRKIDISSYFVLKIGFQLLSINARILLKNLLFG